MVMSQNSNSKLSLVGAGAAACVIALGAFVMPGLACPPEEKAEKQAAEKRAAELAHASGNVIVVTPDGKKLKVKKDDGASAQGGQSGQGGTQFFGEAPALEAMKARKGAQGFSPLAPMSPVPAMPPTPAVAPVAPVPPSGAMFRVAPNTVAIARSGGGGQCGASRSKMVMSSADMKEGRVARVYVLPQGKSEAFYELMSRSDVPILVQQKGNSIVVYATEAQHPTIAGFIKIISPGNSGNPVIVQDRGSGQSAARGAVNADRMRAYQEQVRAYQQEMRGYQQAIRELNANRANVERNAARARGEAERVRAQQEQLEAAAERMSEQAENMADGAAKQKLEAAAEKLRQRAEAAERKSDSTDEQVEGIERQMEDLENRAEELEQRAEELQDRISELGEQADDDRIAELDNEASAADSLMFEMNEGDAVDGSADVMVEIDESPAPDMDDEEEGDEPEGTPVAAPFPPVPSSSSAFSPVPIPSAAPATAPSPFAAPAAPASAAGSSAPAAAPTPSAPAADVAPTPAAPKAQPTPAAASVIAATRKA